MLVPWLWVQMGLWLLTEVHSLGLSQPARWMKMCCMGAVDARRVLLPKLRCS